MTLEQFLQPLSAGLSYSPLTALGITFVGGIVASAVCPCTVPMGLGVAGLAGASQVRARYGGLQVSAAFFAGIVISLTALGGAADDHCNRLPHVANPIGRDTPMLDWQLEWLR